MGWLSLLSCWRYSPSLITDGIPLMSGITDLSSLPSGTGPWAWTESNYVEVFQLLVLNQNRNDLPHIQHGYYEAIPLI